MSHSIRPRICLAAFALATLWIAHCAPALAAQCQLQPLPELLVQPELQAERSDIEPLAYYQRQLARFIRQHYPRISSQLLEGKGQYLDTLHWLMGTQPAARADCEVLFRDMLLTSPSSQGFTQALLLERLAATNLQDQQEPSEAVTYPLSTSNTNLSPNPPPD